MLVQNSSQLRSASRHITRNHDDNASRRGEVVGGINDNAWQ